MYQNVCEKSVYTQCRTHIIACVRCCDEQRKRGNVSEIESESVYQSECFCVQHTPFPHILFPLHPPPYHPLSLSRFLSLSLSLSRSGTWAVTVIVETLQCTTGLPIESCPNPVGYTSTIDFLLRIRYTGNSQAFDASQPRCRAVPSRTH